MSKKYISLDRLSDFLNNLKQLFVTKESLDNLQESINEKTAPASTSLGTVMSGGNVVISDGIITVKDDSHNHIIDNIDGLQDILDTKSDNGHDHNDVYYTKSEIDIDIVDITESISDIVGGTTVVAEASHAISADNATMADSATKATQDGDNQVISETYETKGDATIKLNTAKAYTDEKIGDLVNGAPTTLDTIYEVAAAIEEHEDIIEALDSAIGTKANATDLVSHTGDSVIHTNSTEKGHWDTAYAHSQKKGAGTVSDSNPHGLTASDIGAALSDHNHADKMNVANPVGTGSLSINRKADTTIGTDSVAVGYDNEASGNYSYAEGIGTTASGAGSHAEGTGTIAEGMYSHAEGSSTVAKGYQTHSEGSGTIASGSDQHVQGRYNIEEAYQYAHIVGNGDSDLARSNSHTLDWGGNAWFAGDVYVKSTSGTNKDSGSKKLVTSDEVVQAMTTSEYEALDEKSDTTFYLLTDAEEEPQTSIIMKTWTAADMT